MIYTVTLNPALDKTVEIPDFAVDTVNRITEMRTDPGGKGINVSKVIAKLGGASKALAVLGGNAGRAIAQALESETGLTTEFLWVEGETRTNLKLVDPKNHTNTDINEPGVRVNRDVLNELLARLTAQLADGDIVVLSGSLPAGAPRDTYKVWVEACKSHGAKVFLDADGDLLAEGMKGAPYLIKPNNDELSRLLGRTLRTPEELAKAARELQKQAGIERIVVSMGGKGALYLDRETVLCADGLKVPVGSTVGAGDSVVAALAWAEHEHMSREEMVRLSTATGAANVMCSGTQAAEYAAIEPLLSKVMFRSLEI